MDPVDDVFHEVGERGKVSSSSHYLCNGLISRNNSERIQVRHAVNRTGLKVLLVVRERSRGRARSTWGVNRSH